MDIEIEPYHFKDGRIGFFYRISANEVEGIYREHLTEIVKLLKDKGVEGVSPIAHGKQLQFTGAFRDSVLRRIGIEPEFPPGEPPAVQHLGGYKFKVGDRKVEFGPKAFGKTREFYAELMFPSREEAERFASSLKAIGVDARIAGFEEAGYAVRLDSDSFFGLLAVRNAAPPGLKPLYRSEEGDFRVYASVEKGWMRFYFAVKHEGVWKAVEGLYSEKS